LSPVTDKSETPMLTRDELRKKRLEFYDTPWCLPLNIQNLKFNVLNFFNW
jgi:hypothetical protein